MIKGCRTYERSSQNELYHRFAHQVMCMAKRYMTDDHQAKDVFLRAFEKAFNNIERYDASKGEFSSWLNRITINEALNRIKTQSRFEFVELQEEDFSEGKLEPIDNYDHDKIVELIKKLKMPYGVIFSMIYEGYKHKEVAAEFNITEATSRSYYKRSREMIQKELNHTYKNEFK